MPNGHWKQGREQQQVVPLAVVVLECAIEEEATFGFFSPQ
jgi:hypothetical protein